MTDGTFMGSDAGIPIIKPCIPRTNNTVGVMSKPDLIRLARDGQKGVAATALAHYQSKHGSVPNASAGWVHYKWGLTVQQLLTAMGISRDAVYRIDDPTAPQDMAQQPVIGGKCNDCA